ncbi:MAG: arylsulfatase [Verrucomicrobiota bacterium]
MRTLGLIIFAVLGTGSMAAERPNVLLILADDLGYGDVSAYGAKTIRTPNIDRIAKEGLRMSDGHASASTCTPSRYSLLTGEYAFRKKGTGILPGNAALIIEPGRFTLPAMFQKAGYVTGVVGKWHLGLGTGDIDWNGEVKPGPLEVGFTESFIMAATGDRVPTVYLKDHRVLGLDPADPLKVDYKQKIGSEPTGKENPELLTMGLSQGHDCTIVNGISRIGHMSGGKAAWWRDEDLGDEFTRQATGFIERAKDRPFFLYYASHEPHVPRRPHPRFAGQSGMGPRGDAILALDWSVGEILGTLDRLGLADKTMVIFTSDNGPVLDDGYKDQAVELKGDHQPAGPWRGGKYSLFEGGTRVPFFVRWPGRIKPADSAALVSQVDFLASLAALTGQTLPAGAGPDSQNLLPAFLGESPEGRTELVEHSGRLAFREGSWKLIPPGGGPARSSGTNVELGNHAQPQLFDLTKDPGETKSVTAENADRAASMRKRLETVRDAPERK